MKLDGFAHVLVLPLSTNDDVHYPGFRREWFENKALPILEPKGAGRGETSRAWEVSLRLSCRLRLCECSGAAVESLSREQFEVSDC